MSGNSSIYALLKNRLKNPLDPLEDVIYFFLEKNALPEDLCLEDLVSLEEFSFTEEKKMRDHKRLLSLNLLFYLAKKPSSFLVKQIKRSENSPWNTDCQYFRAILQLNRVLADFSRADFKPELLEGGFAFLKPFSSLFSESFSFNPYHIEFALFLLVTESLSPNEELRLQILNLAKWQLNVLDGEGVPLRGLFVREQEGDFFHHLCVSYLLFRTASSLSEEEPFAFVAEQIFSRLKNAPPSDFTSLDPLWFLVEKYLDRFPLPEKRVKSLKERVYDPSTALLGFREPALHVLTTLHGFQTGLGSLKQGDLEVLTYAPHHLPLAECEGFGIQGNFQSDQCVKASCLNLHQNSFSIKGCVKTIGIDQNRKGDWLDIEQTFQYPRFSIKASFFESKKDSLSFSFFVKSPLCEIENKQFFPGTLSSFEGNATHVIFQGKKARLQLSPLFSQGKMQLISLGGNSAFWGADFLVAYHLEEGQTDYTWCFLFEDFCKISI